MLINETVWAENLGCILGSSSAGADCRMWSCGDGNTQILGATVWTSACGSLGFFFFALLAPIVLSLSPWLFLVSLQLSVVSSVQPLLLCWTSQKLFLSLVKHSIHSPVIFLPSCHQFPSDFFFPLHRFIHYSRSNSSQGLCSTITGNMSCLPVSTKGFSCLQRTLLWTWNSSRAPQESSRARSWF